MASDPKDTADPVNVMEALAHDIVEGTDRAAQIVLAEMAVLAGVLPRAGLPLTDAERLAIDAEVEAGFDNMPI